MIFLFHSQAVEKVKVTFNGEVREDLPMDLVDCFWQLCEKFPDEIILWIDADLDIRIGDQIENIFRHSLIMASYPVQNYFIPDAIGYVDQLPFVNPKRDVKFPTWRMSTDIGGIFGKTALQFKQILREINDFGYLINSIAKIGQQNSLFCYSTPQLLENIEPGKKEPAKVSVLFRFTAQHYKKVRLLVLLFCFIRYEGKFPFWIFLRNLFRRSYFQQNVELSMAEIIREKNNRADSIDVIIPTLGRPEHLKNVLIDLRNQEQRPERVIIVEQNMAESSESQLNYLNSEEWPFRIIHHFTHRVGACNARNIALQEVRSNWIFFADDDIRFRNDLLQAALKELNQLEVPALNLNCMQEGEATVFSRVKQWGAFGSGTTIVRSDYALNCRFHDAFEHGFGEDIDFGMQLRNSGCDIIYHPDIIIKHLKAERGGFRETMPGNHYEKIQPKPAPTMMLLVRQYYTVQMLKGYKTELFLKFYRRQPIKNPFIYYRSMQKRWQLSESLSRQIQKSVQN